MDPKNNRYYVGYDSKKGSAVVRFHLPEETKLILSALYVLGDLYVSIGQHVSGNYIKDSLQETAADRLLRRMGIESKNLREHHQSVGNSKSRIKSKGRRKGEVFP